MEALGKILLFIIVVLVLPAVLLWGGHWAVTTLTPGFAAALAGIAPYLLWFALWCVLAYVAFLIFAEAVD